MAGNDNNDRIGGVSVKLETVTENDTENGDETMKMNEDQEDENMESLLLASFGEDGDFLTTDEKEEAAAVERRRKRKRRLERLEASAGRKTNATKSLDATATSTTASSAIKIETKQEAPVVPKKADAVATSTQPSHSDHVRVMKAFHESQSASKSNQDDAGGVSNNGGDSDSDDSDMFASPSSEDRARKMEKKQNKKSNNDANVAKASVQEKNSRQDGFDDSDGYYKAAIGETMELEVLGGGASRDKAIFEEKKEWTLKLRVQGIIGKGVFSSVLKCSTSSATVANSSSKLSNGIPTSISLPASNGTIDQQEQQHGLPPEVAIKCIRSNETMAKAALDEIKFLIRLRESPGIVPLLLPAPQNSANSAANPNYVPPPIDFRGHTILVFPYLPYNLRDVLQKFGKGVGLSLGAVQNYFRQLLSAAIHLQKHGVIHADIKPDNILVSGDFSRVLVADFGSAFETKAVVNEEDESAAGIASGQATTHESVTPYLVSRFYRAPEIILGLQPLTYAIDLWSLAVTAGELFLGRVLLKGANNNDMLYTMMQLLGPFSARIIKSHLLQTKKHPLQAHFSQVQSSFVFRQETVDSVLGRPVHKEVSLSNNTTNKNAFRPTLQSKLLKAKSPKDTRSEIILFADLLTKCLVLDPSKRISVRTALKHKFFVQQ